MKTIPEKPVSTVNVQSLPSQPSPSPSHQPMTPIAPSLQPTSNVDKTSAQTGKQLLSYPIALFYSKKRISKKE